MSYVENNLMPNEKVLFTAKISPAIYLAPLVAVLFSFIIFFKAFQLNNSQEIAGQIFGSLILFLSCILFLGSILSGIAVMIILETSEFAVTTRRVMSKTGFIRRKTNEILLSKIESVGIDQGILGRIMNFGTIRITGTGGTSQRIKAIIDPLTVRNKLNQVLERVHSKLNSQANA